VGDAVDRDITPAQQHLAFGLDGALELLLASLARSAFLGQEDHADAVFAGRRQLHALLGHFGAIELVGDLDQQTGTVTHQRVGAHGAPVIDVLEDLQALLHDAVRLQALDVRNEAHAAGVVFGAGVQAGVGCSLNFFARGRDQVVSEGRGRERGSRSRLGHVGAPKERVRKQLDPQG